MEFDYDSLAELFMPKQKGVGRRAAPRYRRFATAAEAIRFAVEEMPPSGHLALGCKSERSTSTEMISVACTKVANISFDAAAPATVEVRSRSMRENCIGIRNGPTVAQSSVKLPLVQKMTQRFDQTWNLMMMAITLSALATPTMAESDSKKERVEDACVTAAMTDYVKANDALVQQTATVMSVDATIAQRRLQEEYCLRFVRCSLDDRTVPYFEFNSTAASRMKR